MYNLLHEPWIPVQRKNGDTPEYISPHQMTAGLTAGPVTAVAAPRPDFNGALLQFLIGLVQTACPPENESAWQEKFWHPPSSEELKAAFLRYADAFYLDGDGEFPTICGTGTEDYFCGSYDFEDPVTHANYVPFTTPYAGLHQVITPDKLYGSQFRFGMYRWHVADPIYFEKDLRVTMQALGWREGKRYLPLQDDIASVAYWYQQLPTAPFPALPDKDYLEII